MASLPQYYNILVSPFAYLARCSPLIALLRMWLSPPQRKLAVQLLILANHCSDEVRAAYKRESLRTHPDRLPQTATPQQRRAATERFVGTAQHHLTRLMAFSKPSQTPIMCCQTQRDAPNMIAFSGHGHHLPSRTTAPPNSSRDKQARHSSKTSASSSRIQPGRQAGVEQEQAKLREPDPTPTTCSVMSLRRCECDGTGLNPRDPTQASPRGLAHPSLVVLGRRRRWRGVGLHCSKCAGRNCRR